MMYPFMTLNDGTEIVHSQLFGNGSAKIYIEKPHTEDCYHCATCSLPAYVWNDVFGFSIEELALYEEILRSCAHLLLEFAGKGGFDFDPTV